MENSFLKFCGIYHQPIHHNHPDIAVVDTVTNKGYFIDVTIPGDVRVKTKTTEKLYEICKLLCKNSGVCPLQ